MLRAELRLNLYNMGKEKVTKTENSIKIDASGQILGRLAAQVAALLRGKDRADFVPYKIPERKIVIFNTDKIAVTGKKLESKIYYWHSGYPGGLKKRTLGRELKRDSGEVIRRAVYGMLPKNKLRNKMINNLVFHREELPK